MLRTEKPTFDDYGYLNTRVKGMHSRLLDKGFYERLLGCKSLREMINMLGETPYAAELEEYASIGDPDMDNIEAALMHNLTKTFRVLLGFMKGAPRNLTTVLLSRWDVLCIKSILRGKSIGAPNNEIISSLIPAGELEFVSLKHLVNESPSINAVIDTMLVWELPYAKPLQGKDNVLQMELALDQFYYEQVFKKLKGRSSNTKMLKRLMGVEVDMSNIITLLRLQTVDIDKESRMMGARFIDKFLATKDKELADAEEAAGKVGEPKTKEEKKKAKEKAKEAKKRAKVLKKRARLKAKEEKKKAKEAKKNGKPYPDPALVGDGDSEATESKEDVDELNLEEQRDKFLKHYYIDGGNELDFKRFTELSYVKSVEEVLDSIKDPVYKKHIKEAQKSYMETGSFSYLQRKTEKVVVDSGVNMYKVDPFSIGVITGFIWKKFNEIVNLRIILRCKHHRVPEERVREELIGV